MFLAICQVWSLVVNFCTHQPVLAQKLKSNAKVSVKNTINLSSVLYCTVIAISMQSQ